MKTTPLGNLATVMTGGTPDRGTPAYWGGSIPWVGTGEIDFNVIASPTEYLTERGLKESAARLLTKGTLLMAMYGKGTTREKVGILAIEAATNQACAAIIPKAELIESEFLFYMLEANYTRIRRLSNTGSQENLNTTLIREIPVPVLSKTARDEIVSAAREWNAAIEKATALLAALEQRKQGLMQQLLTGRRRLKGFKARWKMTRADQLFDDIAKRSQLNEQLLSVTQDRGVIPRTMLVGRVTMPSGDVNSFKLVEPDNFVISLRSFQGGLEHSAYRGLVSPAYTVLEADTAKVHAPYFRQYFKSADFLHRLSVAVVGIRDGKQISYTDFKSIKLPLPPSPEQEAIATFLDLADSEIGLAVQRIEQLRTQKRALMQKLLSGNWHMPKTALPKEFSA